MRTERTGTMDTKAWQCGGKVFSQAPDGYMQRATLRNPEGGTFVVSYQNIEPNIEKAKQHTSNYQMVKLEVLPVWVGEPIVTMVAKTHTEQKAVTVTELVEVETPPEVKNVV